MQIILKIVIMFEKWLQILGIFIIISFLIKSVIENYSNLKNIYSATLPNIAILVLLGILINYINIISRKKIDMTENSKELFIVNRIDRNKYDTFNNFDLYLAIAILAVLVLDAKELLIIMILHIVVEIFNRQKIIKIDFIEKKIYFGLVFPIKKKFFSYHETIATNHYNFNFKSDVIKEMIIKNREQISFGKSSRYIKKIYGVEFIDIRNRKYYIEIGTNSAPYYREYELLDSCAKKNYFSNSPDLLCVLNQTLEETSNKIGIELSLGKKTRIEEESNVKKVLNRLYDIFLFTVSSMLFFIILIQFNIETDTINYLNVYKIIIFLCSLRVFIEVLFLKNRIWNETNFTYF